MMDWVRAHIVKYKLLKLAHWISNSMAIKNDDQGWWWWQGWRIYELKKKKPK